MSELIESRRRRLKRKGMRWPKWLRSKFLIRWLFILGPLVYRAVRMFRMLFGPDE
jgi:hypothetical protein